MLVVFNFLDGSIVSVSPLHLHDCCTDCCAAIRANVHANRVRANVHANRAAYVSYSSIVVVVVLCSQPFPLRVFFCDAVHQISPPVRWLLGKNDGKAPTDVQGGCMPCHGRTHMHAHAYTPTCAHRHAFMDAHTQREILLIISILSLF